MRRAGTLVDEARCGIDANPVGDPGPNNCPFYYFPGTVGWMRGFLQYEEQGRRAVRSGPRGNLPPCVLRPRSRCSEVHVPVPRRDDAGNETLYADATAKTCAADDAPNPLFRVPKTITGVAQLPGQRLMISTGLWDHGQRRWIAGARRSHDSARSRAQRQSVARRSAAHVERHDEAADVRAKLQARLHEHHELSVSGGRTARRHREAVLRLLARREPG